MTPLTNKMEKLIRVILILGLPYLLITGEVYAQDAADFYKQNCMSCHSIGGGRLSGPDLKNVSERKERDWLVKFMLNPKGTIDSGDPYALELLREARGTVMPTISGLTKAKAETLLDLIEAESKLEKSQFFGIQISDRPFTPKDIEMGREIFMGTLTLANDGPSCISCHAVQGVGGFGGGALAPDLTTVFERYEGRKALATWLSAPATPTMNAVYRDRELEPEEVLATVAFFQNTLSRSPEDMSTERLNFVLIGLAGVVVLLGLFDVVWNKRFRAVRRPLVLERKVEKLHESK